MREKRTQTDGDPNSSHRKKRKTESDCEAFHQGEPNPRLLVKPKELESLKKKGFHFYHFPFIKKNHLGKKTEMDFDSFQAYLDSFGRLVWEDGNLEHPNDEALIVFATVLGMDFASSSLKTPPEAIREISLNECLSFKEKSSASPQYPKQNDSSRENRTPEGPKDPVNDQKTPSKVMKPPPADSPDETVQSPTAKTIRVNTDLLNKLMNLAGELILSRNQLLQKLENKDLPELQSLNQRLSELQESVMQTRLQQVGAVFRKVPRLVRDLSKALGKKIEVEIDGEEVELDRAIIESISDPLIHLVRNSIDHGIELPEKRLKAGKAEHGALKLRAFHEGGHVHLEIKDDGAGIDPDLLKFKALEMGLYTDKDIEVMGKHEALNLIFKPGFSTAQKVTEVSGRGVGMDVVKTQFEKLGGTVDIQSDLGIGTSVMIKLPTTLAIVSAVILKSESEDFAIPQSNIEEIVCIKEHEMASKLERVGQYQIYRLRGKLLPVIRLADILNLERTFLDEEGQPQQDRRKNLADRRSRSKVEQTDQARRAEGERRRNPGKTQFITVLRVGVHQYGLLVDQIKDVEEIVVKPLSSFVKEIKSFHGATILGDGRVIMILDCNGIAELAHLRFDNLQDLSDSESQQTLADHHESQRFLVFNNHPEETFAIPLSFITRIEKVNVSHVERIGDKELVQIGGKSIPLFRLEKKIQCKEGVVHSDGQFYLLIPKLVQSPYAIVATRVQDVVTTTVAVQTDVLKQEGVLGTSTIDGKLTLMLDIYGLFEEKRHTDFMNNDISHKVLLVEDTPFFRAMIRAYLQDHGLEVIESVNGSEAWELLEDGNTVDLVLSDIEMPIMNGYELVRKIKSSERHHHLPVLAITALDNHQAKAEGEKAGFDAYQVKLDRHELIKTIDTMLASLP